MTAVSSGLTTAVLALNSASALSGGGGMFLCYNLIDVSAATILISTSNGPITSMLRANLQLINSFEFEFLKDAASGMDSDVGGLNEDYNDYGVESTGFLYLFF
jgi:hypothetical protein